MPTYIFASLRREDFEIEGKDEFDALTNLLTRDRDKGTLWRLNDPHRNKAAVEKQGFSKLHESAMWSNPVFRIKE